MTRCVANNPVFETGRLRLTRPDQDDWSGFRTLYPSEASAFAGGPLLPSRARHLFARHIGHWSLRSFGLFSARTKDGGRSVGMVGPYFPDGWPKPELGWLLWPGETGRGYATEAVRAARDFVREALGWRRIVSYIHPENAASIAVAERLECMRDAAPRGLTPDNGALVYRHPEPETLQ